MAPRSLALASVIFILFAEFHLARATDVTIDRIEGGTVYFKTPDGAAAPKPLKLAISDGVPIGVLRPLDPANEPYLLIKARPCTSCAADRLILVFHPSDPHLTRLVEPGRIIDHKTGALVVESRAFYGRCLTDRKNDVLVAFQKEKVDKRHGFQSSVLIVEPGLETVEGGKPLPRLQYVLLEHGLPRINRTLRLVKQRACHEIDGRYRVTASRPYGVAIKGQKLPDDDDQDSPPDDGDDSDDSAD